MGLRLYGKVGRDRNERHAQSCDVALFRGQAPPAPNSSARRAARVGNTNSPKRWTSPIPESLPTAFTAPIRVWSSQAISSTVHGHGESQSMRFRTQRSSLPLRRQLCTALALPSRTLTSPYLFPPRPINNAQWNHHDAPSLPLA